MLLSYQGLVNCTSGLLHWPQSLVMRCYDMCWIILDYIDMLCWCKSADPTCGFAKSPWDSIATAESGHVSSLRFQVSLRRQCRCWMVLRCHHNVHRGDALVWPQHHGATFSSMARRHPSSCDHFTGQCSNLLYHLTISLCFFDACSFFAVLETWLESPSMGVRRQDHHHHHHHHHHHPENLEWDKTLQVLWGMGGKETSLRHTPIIQCDRGFLTPKHVVINHGISSLIEL